MTQEEKAKRYDEAIERARKIKNGEPINVPNGTLIPDAIFPELEEESEDESIRKAIIRCIKCNMPDNDFRKKYIAWLEKQVEQNPVWSEEDEEMFDSIIEEVRYIGDFPDYPTKEENELYDKCLAKVEWLKSLKDRYTWKPSDEQKS